MGSETWKQLNMVIGHAGKQDNFFFFKRRESDE